jgi:DNA-binding transcriptional ArsR family regulator
VPRQRIIIIVKYEYMKRLSLRARGLLALLSSSGISTVQSALSACDESQQYIEHTLKELEDAGLVTTYNGMLEVRSEGVSQDPNSLQERIYNMFYTSKTYEVIAWFLAQLDKTFELDSELRERVLLEYDAASVVRFWDSYNIEQALKRALVDKSIGNVTLEDLRELLRKKDKGEIVWEK